MFRLKSWFKRKKKATGISVALLGVLAIGVIWGAWRHQTLRGRLIGAVRREDAQAVKDLLAQGADPNATTGAPVLWENFLHFITSGRSSDPNRSKAGVGEPVLLLVGAERSHRDTAAEDAICTTLLQKGAKPTVRDSAGFTILFYASQLHLHHSVQLLLSAGVSPNDKLPDGETPLLGADATDTLALLQHGANVSEAPVSGDTALHYACSAEDPDTVRLLLANHADVNAKDAQGVTPLMLAHDPNILRQLLDHGADVDARTLDGSTAITFLCNTPSPDIEGIKLLLQHRAHINDHFRSDWSALHYACSNSNVPLARFLLDHGADIEQQTSEGLTPLMCAREPAIVRLLLSRGARIDTRDDYGRTALDFEMDLVNKLKDPNALKVIPILQQYAATHASKSEPIQGQGGREILLKSMQMYQSLHSYAGEGSCIMAFNPQSGLGSSHSNTSSTLKFQRPNKIYLSFLPVASEFPGSGEVRAFRQIMSDGTNFSLYDTATQQAFTVPTANDLTGLMRLLATKAEVSANLDLLYFLSHKDLPKELSDLKVKESTTYEGHPVYVVTGTTHATPPLLKSDKFAPVLTSDWMWWIDRKTSQLYKVETTTPNVVMPVENPAGSGTPGVVKRKGTLFIRLTVSSPHLNADLTPSDFVLMPPQAAPQKH